MSLGALFQGLSQGIETRDRMDLNRQRKRLWEQEAHKGEMAIAGGNDVLEALGMETMPFQGRKDPALIRFGGWLKDKMGFGGGEGSSSASAIQTEADTEEPQMSPVANPPPTQLVDTYQDGGRVRPRGRGYSDRRRKDPITWERGVPSRDVPTSGGGVGAFMGDLGRSAANYFDDTRRSALAGDEDVYEEFDQLRNSETAAQAGGNFRDWAIDSARAGGATTIGLAKDLTWDNPVIGGPIKFVGGMFGIGDDEDIAERTSAPPADAPTGAGAAVEARGDTPEQSDEEVAQQAIQTGEELAAENFDYRYLPEDTRAEDLPTMTTQDWVVDRRLMMQGLLKQGMDPQEALGIVDDVTVGNQMRGMARELAKAEQYLAMGDLRATGFAIRQGFQYFPNGVDVKLAVQTGPNGEQALVAFGVDEETGEPTGTPQLINQRSLAMMREQFSDPKAFRAWTKDAHDLQMEIAKLRDLSAYRQDSLDLQAAGIAVDAMRARNAGQAGGMDYGDVDRRSGLIVEALERQEFGENLPEGALNELAAAGGIVMRLRSNWDAEMIAKNLRDAWNGESPYLPEGGRGGEAGVIELIEALRGE